MVKGEQSQVEITSFAFDLTSVQELLFIYLYGISCRNPKIFDDSFGIRERLSKPISPKKHPSSPKPISPKKHSSSPKRICQKTSLNFEKEKILGRTPIEQRSENQVGVEFSRGFQSPPRISQALIARLSHSISVALRSSLALPSGRSSSSDISNLRARNYRYKANQLWAAKFDARKKQILVNNKLGHAAQVDK